MRRLSLALLLLIVAFPARGAGSGLRWNSCRGPSNRAFACDRSTGSELLVGSFESPTSLQLCGVEVYMRITTADGAMPSWWQMYSRGSCRQSSLSVEFDVSTETECDDPWQGQAMGGLAYYDTTPPSGGWPTQGTGGAYVKFVMAVPQIAAQTVSAGRQYAAYHLSINHSRSDGPAACDGCAKPACIAVELMRLGQPCHRTDPSEQCESRDVDLTTGLSGMGGGANVVTWQGGTPTCGAGLAKVSTWGELKKRFK